MNRAALVGVSALLLGVLIAQVALAGGSGSREIAGLQHQIDQLKAQIAKKKHKRGPRGPAGPPGPPGLQGTTGPQGPGALSFNLHAPSGPPRHVLTTINGVDAFYGCDEADFGFVDIGVRPHQPGDTVFASGDKAVDGTLTSVQSASTIDISATGTSTVNLDVVAWSGSVGKLARFDLGGFHGVSGCNIWGMVVPGS